MSRFKSTMAAIFLFCIMAVIFLHSIAVADGPTPAWEDKYKEEPYIALLVEKSVKINKDYSTVTKVHSVTKIQQDSAKALGEIPINYDKNLEEVEDIEAYTITPDGKKLKYEKIQDLSTSGQSSIYSDVRVKMITMPGVVVGSIIDYKVTIKRKKPVIENNFYSILYFSAQYPIRETRFDLTAPKDILLNIRTFNSNIEPKVENRDDAVTYSWLISNTDKVEWEEYMPSPEEVYKSIEITTLKEWKQLSAWGWPLFKKNIKVSEAIKKKVEEVTGGKPSLEDKIQAIIEYMRNDFRYVGMNMDSHNFEPHPADEIFHNKYGDCKDQTVLAITLLSEIGVKAFPALISTYSDLSRKDLLPMPAYFNHAILALEFQGKVYYTDILYKGYRFQELPDDHQGKTVFVLNDQGGFFTVLPAGSREDNTNLSKEKYTINHEGNAMVETNVIFSRNMSVKMRELFKRLNPDQKNKFFAEMETQMVSGGKILEKSWKNFDTAHTQITGAIRYESTGFVQRMGDMMMFGMPKAERKNIFSSPKRVYPIVITSPDVNESHVTYIVPEGYEIVVLPKKVSLNTPYASYLREYETTGSQISGKEIEAFKQHRIPVEEYPGVQNFFDEIPRKTNEKILIRKK